MKIKNASPIRSLDITLQAGRFSVAIFRVSGAVKIKHISPKAAYNITNRMYWKARFEKNWREATPCLGETVDGAYMERNFYQDKEQK